MILKKPYAFFIRFFKLFHLIMFVFGSILLYRTSLIYGFLKEFVKSSPNVIGKDLVSPLFSTYMYIFIVVLLLVNILIIVILIRKDKPYMFYIFNILLYGFAFAMYLISRRVIGNLEVMLVAAKTTMAVRDITNLLKLFQTVSIVFYLVRATGFDIRKFDFARDLHDLDISPEDSEEYEVAVDFEGNVFLRKFKKIFREFKYYYKENKFLINIFSLLFIGIVGLFIYYGSNKYNKIYDENVFFSADGYKIGILNSNIVSKDFQGSVLFDDSVLVVVKASMSGYSSISGSRAVLVVNNTQYYYSNNYSVSVSDLGNVYNNQVLSSDFSDYLFIYKIPKEFAYSDMYFRYVDEVEYKRGKTYVKSIDVKLSPVDVDNLSHSSYEYALGNEIDLNSSFSGYKVNLNSFDISRRYVINYNSCIRSNECYDFREILNPSVRDHDKVLLRLDGNIVFDNSINGVNNLYQLISKFGSIDYVYNGNTYSEMLDFNLVNSNKSDEKNVYYIEVDKEIMDATSIKLSFNFRNSKYSYVLRGDISE